MNEQPSFIDATALKNWRKIIEQSDNAPWYPDILHPSSAKAGWTGKIDCGFPGTDEHSEWLPEASDNKRDVANIRFICMARTALPMLIDEVIELRRKITEIYGGGLEKKTGENDDK